VSDSSNNFVTVPVNISFVFDTGNYIKASSVLYEYCVTCNASEKNSIRKKCFSQVTLPHSNIIQNFVKNIRTFGVLIERSYSRKTLNNVGSRLEH
jgi:hypothetical protein